MIQETFVEVILADALVSGMISRRIYPLRLPPKAQLPAIVYQRVSVDPVNSLGGDSNLDNVRIQTTCWAQTYEEVVTLALAVRQALNGSSSLKSRTVLEVDTEDRETKNFGVVTDYAVWSEVQPLVPPELDYLLLETLDSILLETGDLLALEV